MWRCLPVRRLAGRGACRVAVVGGGVIGASTALHLAAKGATDVVVFERDASYARASAPRSAGGIRQQVRGDDAGACAFWPYVTVFMVCTSWYVVPITHRPPQTGQDWCIYINKYRPDVVFILIRHSIVADKRYVAIEVLE